MSTIKTILSSLLLLFIASTSFAASPFVKGELLVQQSVRATKAQFDKAIKSNGGSILEEIPQIRVKRIKVPEKNFNKVKAALSKNPNFEFVEENFIAQGMIVPNDPSFASQWHHTKIMSASAWEMGIGSTAVPIAIIDSGVDPDHPDLMTKLMPGFNFVLNNTDTHDVYGHGTAAAGSAAAASNNATGVAGVSWNSPIMPLVVLDSNNLASYSRISSAIVYAVDHGAKVINLSLGGPSFSSTMDNAVNYAWNNGALVFASAANYNTSAPYYPAACTNAVAVAATDSADNKASFSNYGDWITVTAPGVSILTTNNGGGYGYWSGTSFSSPITAGLAALIWSANPQLTNQQVLDVLKSTADDLGATGFDNVFGHGRINAYNAMMEVINFQPELDTEPPSVALTTPNNNATVVGNVSITASAVDNIAVEKVEFRINGTLLATDASAPFAATWNTSAATSGFYTIEAKAFDTSGNASLINTVQVVIEEVVVIADSLPPTVTILSPSNGSTLASRTTVTASAADETGVIEMRVYIDGKLALTQATSSLKWRWNTRKVSKGAHKVKIEARDPAGNVGFDEIVVYK
jgi:subtilisin family serine protease